MEPTPERQVAQVGYRNFVEGKVEALNRGETQPVYRWLKEQISALPEMTVTKAPLTDGDKWKQTKSSNGEVDMVSGSFFNLEGRAVKTPGLSWEQPSVIASQGSIELPTPNGKIQLDASGFVGIIKNQEGKVLLTVGQEPLAQTSKNALVRTPFQTSTAKLKGLLEGKKELDPNLAEVLTKVAKGKSISDLFASGQAEIFPLSPADANRIKATNIGFAVKIDDKATADGLVADGKNRWCSPAEVKALCLAGIVNGHTSSAFAAAA